ncbi:hypothetical protein F4781DRAFT_396198 [Annulohypoxylon bovei var. microspora]|nr:hypothetical protein F4781DRAFT_396198 [Annulohypoxylon bovei var. microspora]
MARKKKQHQTRLTFEPVGSFDSPGQSSPANVRFTKGVGASGSSSRPSQRAPSTPGRSKEIQSKRHGATGPSRKAASPVKLPKASFMPRHRGSRHLVADSDSADESTDQVEEEEEGEGEGEEDAFIKSSQSISTKFRRTGLEAEDDEEDDDEPIIPPSARKRSRPKFIELEDSSDEIASPAKKIKTSLVTPSRLKKPFPTGSSPTKRRLPKSHRTAKQKKIELLRRRRAGEKIDKVTSSEDSDEEKRGIYDSDPEEEFGVLKKFDDEEESEKEEVQEPARRTPKKIRKSTKTSRKGDEDEGEGGDEDDDLENFVVDDDDAPLGAPANLDIPLEFTAQAHRPLKEQFPYVIEWLVHNRIDPAFDRNDPVYTNAWRKLNDEVQGLASSKFASSAWKPEFYRALKARPNIATSELNLSRVDKESGIYDVCDACGRKKHPASQRIVFYGHPYYKDTLAEVDSDSNSDSDSEDSEGGVSDNESIDTQGMALPPAKKEWFVGIVCCTNAETAHRLIHWKHALKEWVEERLQLEGWMSADKLKERERMKDRKRRKLANRIADGWRKEGIVASLYRDFKENLRNARNNSTADMVLLRGL